MEKIKVVILAYKRKYLWRALEAISAQTYKNIEIIIKDDCSPENLKEIAEEYSKIDSRVKYICNKENMLEMESWLEAVKECDTKYMLAVHDDDIIEPEIVERMASVLDTYEDVSMVTCAFRAIDERSFVMREFYLPSNQALIEKLEDKSFLIEKSNGKYDFYFKKNKYSEFFTATMHKATLNPAIMYRIDSLKLGIDENVFENFNRYTAIDSGKDIRINEFGGIYIINELLCNYRMCREQESNLTSIEKYRSAFNGTVEYCRLRSNADMYLSMKIYCSEIFMNYEILNEIQSCNIIELKKNILGTISYIDIDNTLLDNFLIRVKYLQSVMRYGEMRRNYVIWGAGSAGIITKKLLDVLVPNLCLTGFIDSSKKGSLGPYSITSSADYDFNSDELIVVSVSNHFRDIMRQLDTKGLKMLENYILGYGCYSMNLPMGMIRNAAFEYTRM